MAGRLARFFGRQPKLEERYGDDGFGFMPGYGDFGQGALLGEHGYLTPRLAENVAAVIACVAAISNPIASVPALVFRSIPGGREEAPGHSVTRLIGAPNDRQTWPDWVTFTLGQTLLHGNSISIIQRDADGNPTRLIPVPWYAVSVQLLISGRLAFDVTLPAMLFGGTGMPHRYFADEVFWLKDRSDDGYLGRSVLHRAPMVLRAALGIQTFTAKLWDNAAVPSGILTTEQKFSSKEARDQISFQWNQAFSGARHAGKTPILEQGLKWMPNAMSPEDSEVLASRRFTGEEICRLFGVPPPIAGDFQFGSFTNSETAGRWHSSLCLSIWCRRIEAEFQRSVFGADNDHHLLVDLSGLQRGDDAARWQTYALAIQNKILTVNEVRALEGFNPLPDAGEVVPGSEVAA